MAKTEKDSWMLGQACESLGSVFFDHGDLREALKYLRKAGSIRSRCVAARVKWILGYPDSASKDIDETLAYAGKTTIPENLAFAHAGAALVYFMRKESEKALAHAQSALDQAGKSGLREWWAIAPMQCVLGWALAKLGQANKGFEQAQQGLEKIQPLSPTNLDPLVSVAFAETAIIAGQIASGLAAVERAENLARSTGLCFLDPEVYRLKAELLLPQAAGGMALEQRDRLYREVESYFEQAAKTARYQNAKSLELRATVSLVRFLKKSDRAEGARNRLMKLCDWFTEGLDTPDLLEARELLH
jgi:tetratricopeptide (TPR) repeat protein